MKSENRDAKLIFGEALRLTVPAEREAYLDQSCAEDLVIRQEVESLLSAHAQAGDFLNQTRPLPAPDLLIEHAGTRIGRYKLLEQIGEGGFGVVYMAEQEEPVRRRVALKIIKLGMDTTEVVGRFEAERQALAMMDHPNIARVFDGGATDTGRPYFVMELVKGIPITEYCDAHKLSMRERSALFMQVCQAVQHAHQKGVIHRDLKPSNVLVTVQDDRPVPKVIDFGVAKATQARLTEKTVFTRFHQFIGTPAYMSPEQAGLGSLDVDTRSDVYSLGVLLYELLTGRTPFDTQKLLAAGYDAVMRTIREEEPPKPSTRLSTLAKEELSAVAARRGAEPAKLGRLVRGDLDWIVMKALEKDRTRRYETANSFARDVEAYLEQEPVSAAAPSAAYRARRFIGRNRLVVGFSTALALTLVIGTIISAWQAVRAKQSSREADTQRVAATNEAARALRFAEESERARSQTEASAYASRVVLASQRVGAGDLSEADRLLEACPAPLRQWEWHYLKRQCQPDCRVLGGQSNEVLSLAASLDGRWLASLDKDGRMLLWNLKGDLTQPVQTWPPTIRPERFEDKLLVGQALAFSHDAHHLAYVRPVGEDKWALGVVSVGEVISERELLRARGEKLRPLCLSFSPDNRLIMVATSEGLIRSYDASNGREGASYPILAAAFSPDGSRVVSTSVAVQRFDLWPPFEPVRNLRMFDTSTGRELLAITNLLESAALLSMAVSPNGEWVAAGFAETIFEVEDFVAQGWAERGWVVVWDVSADKEILRYKLPKTGPVGLEFSSDGRRLAIACAGLDFIAGGELEAASLVYHLANPGKVLIVDVLSGDEATTLRWHLHDVTSVAFIPGGNRLASASSDRTVRLWELGPSRVIPLGGHGSAGGPGLVSLRVSLSSDGRRIAVPTLKGTLDVVELVTGRVLASVRLTEKDQSPRASFANSAPGLAWLSDSMLHYWDLGTDREAWSLSVTNLGFVATRVVSSPDGRWLALARETKPGAPEPELSNMALLQAGSGKAIAQTKLPVMGSFAFSPDSRFLVAGDWDGNVHLWKTEVGGEVFSWRATEPRSRASMRDLLPKRLTQDWSELAIAIPVTAVAVSPDGSHLATADGIMSAELRLWDMTTKQPKWVGPIASSAIAIAFSPDSRRLAVACTSFLRSGATDVVMFDALSGQELLHLPSRAAVESLAFSPDGARLWGVTGKGMLVFWEASPWPGPVTPPAVALRASVVENPERKSSTRP